MQSRLKNPALLNPEAMQALYALAKSAENKGVPEKTIGLVHLRASQINGCGVCVDMHWRRTAQAGRKRMSACLPFPRGERLRISPTQNELRWH